MEMDKKIENTTATNLKAPSEENLKLDARLDQIYSNTIKIPLEALTKMQFIGTSEEDTEESDATCTVKMTSQYNVEEVNLNPTALLKVFSEAQVHTSNIESDQLAHVCVILGESARVAFNHAREKSQKAAEIAFNQLPQALPGHSTNKKSESARFDQVLKSQLEALTKMQFIGASEKDTEESDATCTVKMTSQYKMSSQYNVEEVNLNPTSLLKILSEAQIHTANIESDQLAHVCVTLGESARVAFNHAREKSQKGSETVYKQIIMNYSKENGLLARDIPECIDHDSLMKSFLEQ